MAGTLVGRDGVGLPQLLRNWLGTAPPNLATLPARLPSNLPGAYFTAELEVTWDGGGRNAGDIAASHLFERAADLTETMSVLDRRVAEHRLNAELGTRAKVPGTSVVAVARVTLDVDEETARTAEGNERHRTQLETWRLLKENVFTDPAMTCVWWLDGHPERLERLPTMDAAFAHLRALVTADEMTPPTQVAHLLYQFVAGLNEEDRQRLISSVGYVLTSFGRHDLADTIRRTDDLN